MLITMFSKDRSSSARTSRSALSASPSGVTRPSRSRISFSSDPALTPTRIGIPCSRAFSTTARTCSGAPMLPGLIRILSAPASMAAIASR